MTFNDPLTDTEIAASAGRRQQGAPAHVRAGDRLLRHLQLLPRCPAPGSPSPTSTTATASSAARSSGSRTSEFLFKSGQLWLLTKNTILYNLAFIIFGNILQIAIAIMLNEIRSMCFKKISQAAMFLPFFISARAGRRYRVQPPRTTTPARSTP